MNQTTILDSFNLRVVGCVRVLFRPRGCNGEPFDRAMHVKHDTGGLFLPLSNIRSSDGLNMPNADYACFETAILWSETVLKPGAFCVGASTADITAI